MRVLLSDREAVDLIRNGVRRADGLLEIDIPPERILTTPDARKVLTFSAERQEVTWRTVRCRLSAMQLRLLQHCHDHGASTFEAAQDAVWGREVSDGAIRAACSVVNQRLADAGIPCELWTHRGQVQLEWV